MIVDEYTKQLSKLQYLWKLKSETHDFNRSLKGLRLHILEIMNHYKDIFEACREAIPVEYKIERSHLRKAKFDVAKSQQTTKAHVVELMAKDIKVDIKKQEQKPENSITTSAPKEDHVSEKPRNEGTDSINQQVQAAK